jgi:SRSO17 transposase
VGVARQDSGTLGKVGHCQMAVTCCDPTSQATWPVAVRLSWPRVWAEAPERGRKAHIPAAMPSQTKPALALRRLDQARAWGVPHRCVAADAVYGDHPHFPAGLEERKYSWSNLPASATLEALAGDAHRRYAVEPFQAEATGELGWDPYQGRL